MQVTAELRWFLNSAHGELKEWFCDEDAHGFSAGGGVIRVDSYLMEPGQVELGLKHRGGKKGVEVKGLVCKKLEECHASPFDGAIELWSKWTSEKLTLDMTNTVTLEKRRWIRKFDTSSNSPVEIRLNDQESPLDKDSWPNRGCGMEFTELRFLDYETMQPIPDSSGWWTLSFESFGKLDSLKESLCSVTALMASRNPPAFDNGFRASYPSFLSSNAPLSVLSGSHCI